MSFPLMVTLNGLHGWGEWNIVFWLLPANMPYMHNHDIVSATGFSYHSEACLYDTNEERGEER